MKTEEKLEEKAECQDCLEKYPKHDTHCIPKDDSFRVPLEFAIELLKENADKIKDYEDMEIELADCHNKIQELKEQIRKLKT